MTYIFTTNLRSIALKKSMLYDFNEFFVLIKQKINLYMYVFTGIEGSHI